MAHWVGELRAGPAACEADDAEGQPGFGGNDVVVTAMSSGARRCDNDVVERPSAAVAGGDRTARRGRVPETDDVCIRCLLELAGSAAHHTGNSQQAPRLDFRAVRPAITRCAKWTRHGSVLTNPMEHQCLRILPSSRSPDPKARPPQSCGTATPCCVRQDHGHLPSTPSSSTWRTSVSPAVPASLATDMTVTDARS